MFSRKTKLIVLFTVFAIVLIYGWRKGWFGSGKVSGGQWEAVPENACMVVECTGWDALMNKSNLSYSAAFQSAILGQTIDRIISECDELAGKKNNVPTVSFLASYHLAKVGQLDALVIIENGAVAKACKRGLKKAKNENSATSYQYKRKPIYQLTDHYGKELTIVVIDDVLLASYTSFLVEDALAQLMVGSGTVSELHSALASKSAAKADLRLLYVYTNSPLWLGGFMKAEEVKRRDGWAKFARASWLNIELAADGIKAAGNTLIADEDELAKFTSEVTSPHVIPQVQSFKPFVFESRSGGSRAERFLSRWFTGNAWLIKFPTFTGASIPPQVIMLASDDNETKKDTLLSVFGIKTPKNADVSMVKIPAGWQKRVLGRNYFKADSIWLLIGNEYVVIARNDMLLHTWKSSIEVDDSTATTPASYLMQYKSWLPKNPEVEDEEIVNPYAALQQLLSGMTVSIGSARSGIAETFIEIKLKGLQTTPSLIPMWAMETAGAIARGPYHVEDDRGRLYFYAQDSARHLYCWDSDGKQVWKRQLDGLIVGEPYGMDYYNNRQLVTILSTVRTVYAFNAKGAPAGGYPLKLAVNAAAVAFYGKDSRGQFFVTGTNGDVYGFDMTGRPISGMAPLKANSQPFRAVRWGGRDRLLTVITKDNQVKTWQNSRLQWSKKLPSKPIAQPVVTDPDSVRQYWGALLEGGIWLEISRDTIVTTRKLEATSNVGIADHKYLWSFSNSELSLIKSKDLVTVFSVQLPAVENVVSVKRSGSMAGVNTNAGIFWIDMGTGFLLNENPVDGAVNGDFFYLQPMGLSGALVTAAPKRLNMWLMMAR